MPRGFVSSRLWDVSVSALLLCPTDLRSPSTFLNLNLFHSVCVCVCVCVCVYWPYQLYEMEKEAVYENKENTNTGREFPDGPVVKTSCFHCRGHGFDSWSGN